MAGNCENVSGISLTEDIKNKIDEYFENVESEHLCDILVNEYELKEIEIMDIKDFEIGNHCFGDILKVNGKNYDELAKEDVIEFILDMLKNDINSDVLIKNVFKFSLMSLQYECIESDDCYCDQCGEFNTYSKYSEELP